MCAYLNNLNVSKFNFVEEIKSYYLVLQNNISFLIFSQVFPSNNMRTSSKLLHSEDYNLWFVCRLWWFVSALFNTPIILSQSHINTNHIHCKYLSNVSLSCANFEFSFSTLLFIMGPLCFGIVFKLLLFCRHIF